MTYPFDRIVLLHASLSVLCRRWAWGMVGCFFLCSAGYGQDAEQVQGLKLPSLLGPSAGLGRSELRQRWEGHRRQEILQQFEQHVYGKAPHKGFEVTVLNTDWQWVGPYAAKRKTIQAHLAGPMGSLEFKVTLWLPEKSLGPCPVFLGMHLFDSGSLQPVLGQPWKGSSSKGPELASQNPSWLWQQLFARGFGAATVDADEMDPDQHDGFKNGVHGLFHDATRQPHGDRDWGTLAAWAWGLSRALDVLARDQEVDGERVMVVGHSRMGKAALWAGATDERFAMVFSNNSGCGGAALSRRRHGETVAHINRVFPHWFCSQFHAYGDAEDEIPVDQHQLIALMAPRPVYVASALEDDWADPKGEFLSAYRASEVYSLYDKAGCPGPAQPELNQSVGEGVGYHLRSGRHDLTTFDWMCFLDFAEAQPHRSKRK